MSESIGRRPVYTLPQRPFQRPDSFVKSPFRYPGGKFYGLRHILPFTTCVPHDEYREPFVGGGNVFFAKPRSKCDWLNDLEKDLMTTYRVIADKHQRMKLMEMLSSEVASKERHAEVKTLEARSPLEIAFKTYYLNRTSYSGIIHKPAWGYREGKSSPPENWGGFIEAAGRKLDGVRVTAADFAEVIATPSRGGKVLMYLDPPYYHADQKRAYTKHFVIEDHDRLANLLRQTDHLFCLSYGDCPEIRDLYSWAETYERSWLYNTANIRGKRRITGNELVITNYQVLGPSQLPIWD